MANLIPKHSKNKAGKKRISNYQAEFYDPHRRPKRKRITLRTKDKRAARLKLTELERQYMANQFDPWCDTLPQKGVLVQEAKASFLKAKKQAGLRPTSIKNYADVLRIFEESLPPDLMINRITTQQISDFLDERNINSISKKTYLRQLKVFFNWCQKANLISLSPLPEAKRYGRQNKTVIEFLSREEFQLLVRCIQAHAAQRNKATKANKPNWLEDVLRFAVFTGFRLGEICNLRWHGVDLANGYVYVKNTNDFETKSGHERSVYLAGDAKETIIRLYKPGLQAENTY